MSKKRHADPLLHTARSGVPDQPVRRIIVPRLFLLRHAKAAWAAPGSTDFERPLTTDGMRAARAAGASMRSAGLLPDVALVSPALRTRQTFEGLAESLKGIESVSFEHTLYEGGGDKYLEALRRVPADTESVLIVGHNPMTEDFGEALAGSGDEAALEAMRAGFPVCGLAVLQFAVPLPDVTLGGGHLESFDVYEG